MDGRAGRVTGRHKGPVRFNDASADPYEPDVLMPSELAFHAGRATAPEERLLLAIFEGALNDALVEAVGRPLERRLEARAWFFDDSSEAQRWPMSFRNICLRFGIDLAAARTALVYAFTHRTRQTPHGRQAIRGLMRRDEPLSQVSSHE